MKDFSIYFKYVFSIKSNKLFTMWNLWPKYIVLEGETLTHVTGREKSYHWLNWICLASLFFSTWNSHIQWLDRIKYSCSSLVPEIFQFYFKLELFNMLTAWDCDISDIFRGGLAKRVSVFIKPIHNSQSP